MVLMAPDTIIMLIIVALKVDVMLDIVKEEKIAGSYYLIEGY